MNAKDLRGKLRTIKNNYALTQAGIMFMALPDAELTFDDCFSIISKNSESETFGYIRYLLADEALFKHGSNQLSKFVLRGCLKEMFELLKVYCREPDEKRLLKAAPWYQFLRIIRNSLSHDFHLIFNKYDKSILPVTWDDLTIDVDMDGSELLMAGFFTRVKALKLMDEVSLYVEKNFG